jgi:hypothetical protein
MMQLLGNPTTNVNQLFGILLTYALQMSTSVVFIVYLSLFLIVV